MIFKRFILVMAGVFLVALILLASKISFAESEGEDTGGSDNAPMIMRQHTGIVSEQESENGSSTEANGGSEQGSDKESMDSDSLHHHRSATSTMHEEDSQRNSDERGDNENNNADTKIEIDHEAALQATTTVERSDDVHNRGELRSFLNHLVKEDDRVANVQVSSTTVDTNYSLPAKFLWAIPIHIPAQISVDTNGSVTITYPWYAFLFAKHDSELKSQLTQAASSSASTTLSVSDQAHLLNAVFSILKGD